MCAIQWCYIYCIVKPYRVLVWTSNKSCRLLSDVWPQSWCALSAWWVNMTLRFSPVPLILVLAQLTLQGFVGQVAQLTFTTSRTGCNTMDIHGYKKQVGDLSVGHRKVVAIKGLANADFFSNDLVKRSARYFRKSEWIPPHSSQTSPPTDESETRDVILSLQAIFRTCLSSTKLWDGCKNNRALQIFNLLVVATHQMDIPSISLLSYI